MCKWICFNRLSCNDSGEAEQLHSSNSQEFFFFFFFFSLKPFLLVLIMETGCDSFLNLHHVCILLILWSESSKLSATSCWRQTKWNHNVQRDYLLYSLPAGLQIFVGFRFGWIRRKWNLHPCLQNRKHKHTHPHTAFNSYLHMHLYFTH